MLKSSQDKLKKKTLDLLKDYVATGDERAANALKRFIGTNFSHEVNQEAYQLMEPLRVNPSQTPAQTQSYAAFKKKQSRPQTLSPDPVVVDEEGGVEEVPINVLTSKTPEEFSAYFDHDKEAMITFAKESGLDVTVRKNYGELTIAERILDALKDEEE